MANTKTTIALEIDVNSEEGAKSLRQLKAEFKELQTSLENAKEGTQEYYNAIEKLAATKDDIQRLNEQINAQAGLGNKIGAIANIGNQIASGFAAAQGAMALFGTESKEVEATLLKVQAAMALAQGIKELEGFADAFADAKQAIVSMYQGIVKYISGLEGATAAQKLFNFIASLNPVGIMLTAVTALGAGLVILAAKTKVVTEENEKFRDSINKTNLEIDGQIQRNNELIKLYDGVYGKEKDLQNLRRENNKLSQQELKNKIEAAARDYASATVTLDTYRKQYGELAKLNSNFNIVETKFREQIITSGRELLKLREQLKQLQIEEANDRLKAEGEKKKADDEKKKKLLEEAEKNKESELDRIRRERERREAEELRNEETIKSLKEFDDSNLAEKKRYNDSVLEGEAEKNAAIIQASLDRYEKEKQIEDEKKKDDDLNKKFAIETAHDTLQMISDLTTIFAGKSKEAQKRAFQINKAASIANTTISTWEAAQGAYKSQMATDTPDAPIRATIAAGIAVAQGFIRVAAIAKTKFDESGSGGTGGISGGGGDIGTFSQNNIQNGVNNTSTLLSNINNPQSQTPVKAYVVEQDVTGMQNVVKKITDKSKIE